MILIDYSQVAISSLMSAMSEQSSKDVSLPLVRHAFFNSILSFRKKWRKKEYGNLVICADGSNYWRKKEFPYYKKNRAKSRQKSPYDWEQIYDALDKLKKEIRENFPYRFVTADCAEADDVIAVLCKYANRKRKVLIVSTDKDYLQLQKYPNVEQYSPYVRRFIISENPERDLLEKVLRGDAGDGIPNFRSASDTYITEGKRCKSIMSKKMDVWLQSCDPNIFCETAEERAYYERNRKLIDFSFIPKDVEKRILHAYKSSEPKAERSNLHMYFSRHNLTLLMESVHVF